MSGNGKNPGLIKQVAKEMKAYQETFGETPGVNMDDARAIIDGILTLVFPHFRHEGKEDLGHLEDDLEELRKNLNRALGAMCRWDKKTCSIKVDDFLTELPAMAAKVREDAEALYRSDPAAQSLDEVILAYPGCYAVSAYRFAHKLLKMGVPLLPRLISEYAHRITGIDINPGATIGKSLYIDHGTGVVIGETAVIGDNVQIYQGVTLGALKVDKDDPNKRHPTIEDNVIIYSGATILGGKTIIGHDSVIGGNVWITRSILPHSRVMYRSSDEAESGLNWTI